MTGPVNAFGSGTPLVLIPGIQGRWEWMWPAIRPLAERHRVYTFSLGQAPGPGLFEGWSRLIDQVAAESGQPVALVGISFGGLVGAYYAGLHPDRVSRVVFASTPSPRWQLDRRSARYVRHPRLALPLFALRGAARLHREVRASLPSFGHRVRFAIEHLGRTVIYPPSAPHMARCVHEWRATDLASLCGRITAPALVITGEPALDNVVPVASSLEFLTLLPDARHVTLDRTGHLGLVLRPREFAGLVTDFVDGGAAPAVTRRDADRRAARGARELAGPSRAT